MVSVIIAAHNEESGIGEKLKNLLAASYPRERMEILVGSDGILRTARKRSFGRSRRREWTDPRSPNTKARARCRIGSSLRLRDRF